MLACLCFCGGMLPYTHCAMDIIAAVGFSADYSTNIFQSCVCVCMRSMEWCCHVRVAPARLLCWAHVACAPRLRQRQSSFAHAVVTVIEICRIIGHNWIAFLYGISSLNPPRAASLTHSFLRSVCAGVCDAHSVCCVLHTHAPHCASTSQGVRVSYRTV